MLKYRLIRLLYKLHILPKSICAKYEKQLSKEYCKIALSKYFNKKWYCKQNNDIRRLGIDPVLHYLEIGWLDGKNPSKTFDGSSYLASNLDVKDKNINPLLHYECNGKKEGRRLCIEAPLNLPFSIKEQFANKIKDIFFSKKRMEKILIISHEMSYSGACLSLLMAVRLLKECGCDVKIISLKNGALKKEFVKLGVKVKVCAKPRFGFIDLLYYDMAIVNTIIPYKHYNILSNLMPTVWWVREDSQCLKNNIEFFNVFAKADNVYTMSDLSREQFLPYNENIKVMKHGLEDSYKNNHIESIDFAVIGSIESRKGQDLFIEAIALMDDDLRKKAKFYIIGRTLSKAFFAKIRKNAADFPEVEFIDEIADYSKIISFYERIGCLVAPSRQEPTSRVAIEAMMMGRPVIMSENVGAKYLIENGKNGFIFGNENAKELSLYMSYMIENTEKVNLMEEAARCSYMKHNSIASLKQSLQKMLYEVSINKQIKNAKNNPLAVLEKLEKNAAKKEKNNNNAKSVSIIIPIYNALGDVKKLLDSILKSNLLQETEIILMDDCSESDTKEFLEDFVLKTKFFKLIRNKENLGFIKTCNKGIKESKNDIVVLLNSDTIIPNAFDQKILECFKSDKNIAFASPVSSNTGLFELSTEVNQENINHINMKLNSKPSYPSITPEGFCFCCNKEVFSKIGYLDEIYGMGYSEEDDIVLRAIVMGYRTVLIDNLLVCHKRHASFGSDRRKKMIEHNNAIFLSRWGNFRQLVRKHFDVFAKCKNIVDRIDEL